jgi:hypothetical protein
MDALFVFVSFYADLSPCKPWLLLKYDIMLWFELKIPNGIKIDLMGSDNNIEYNK